MKHDEDVPRKFPPEDSCRVPVVRQCTTRQMYEVGTGQNPMERYTAPIETTCICIYIYKRIYTFS